MRLVSITLTDFRGVTDCTVPFSDGVTIVEGPNEIGKSSIPEAIRLLRTMKASSKHRDIHAVQAIGRDSGPAVQLRLRTGPYDLTYRKRWLKSPVTELTIHAPAPEQLTGDAAHERFDAILAETADLNLVTALEIVQGQSLAKPDFAPIVSLQRALDDSGGEFAGDDDVMAAIQAEYAVYFTPGGKSTGEYRDSELAATEYERQREELHERSAGMDDLINDQSRALATRDRVADELAAARTASTTWRAAAQRIDAVTRAAEDARRTFAEAGMRHQRAQRENAERAALRREVEARLAQLSDVRQALQQHSAYEATLASGRSAADEAVREAETVRQAARAAAEAAMSAVLRRRRRVEHDQLSDRVERARAAQDRSRADAAALDANRVSDRILAAIESAVTEVRVADAARDAAAARVTVRALGGHPITVDGEAVVAGAPAERRARLPVRVEVADLAEIVVEPGTPPADLDARLSEARRKLADALRDAGVESVDQARLSRQQRNETEAERAGAAAALESVLAGDELAALEERLAVLETQLGTQEGPAARRWDAVDEDASPADAAASVASVAADTGSDDEMTLPQLEDAAAAAAELDRVADDELQEARRRAGEHDRSAAQAREARIRAEVERDSARGEQERAVELLAAARAERDDAALEAEVDSAAAEEGDARGAVEAAEAAVAAADPETVLMQRDNADALVESKSAQLSTAREDVARLDALLDERAGEGLYDKLAAADAALDAALERRDRVRRRATAARLLRDTMLRHRSLAQQRYVEPFAERIDGLGRVVFGDDFAVQVSAELALVSRTLGGTTVPFESLSAGAKEQLALIGRLACAQLVADDEGAPVILDDALGFADPERLASVGAVLGRVGRSAQVVVLTCQPERYAHVGGATTVRLGRGGQRMSEPGE